MKLIHLESADSTNSYARRIITECDDFPILITADSQTCGRGRQGHSFYSPDKTGIYMTVGCFFNDCKNCPCPTAAAAVAVYDCLAKNVPCPELLKIKWVNDIYYAGKKVAGILTERFENDGESYLITGVGINVSTGNFPDEIKCKAGNISVSPEKSHELIKKLPEEIAVKYYSFISSGTSEYMNIYRANSFVLSKGTDIVEYTENGIVYTGKAIKINDDATLTVRLTDNSEKIISSGEIQIEGIL